MSSRTKARELRHRRHRTQERVWARNHPAGTAVITTTTTTMGTGRLHARVRRVSTHPWKTDQRPSCGFVTSTIPATKAYGSGNLTAAAMPPGTGTVPALAGSGVLMAVTVSVTVVVVGSGSAGRGCLSAKRSNRSDLDYSPDYASPTYQERLRQQRPAGWPPSLMEPGAPRGSAAKPWACIWWLDIGGAGFRAYATFWPTEEIARQHKCVDPSAIVVNTARTKREYETVDGALRVGRGVIANPYPAERKNFDPLSMSASYDGWRRAAARPLSSSFQS